MERTLVSETVRKIGEVVTIQGWVNTRRDHGKIIFYDLRDRSGILQAVATKELAANPEDVVEVVGLVKERPENLKNPKLETGGIELEVQSLTVLNPSQPLPFPIDTDGYEINEESRLKYRYVDLRRSRLQKNLRIRSKYIQAAREYLFKDDFVEIETPLLTKSTPEGSRDFVVPSRLQPGKFFALPQSPQQYKQLLMTGGFERYFQIARAIRDEDPRADRGFEHTQIDLEMSFVKREDVMKTVEEMTIYALEKAGFTILQKPFPIISYREAMEKYGADKFDLRTPEQKEAGVMAFAWVVDFPFFEQTPDGGWTFTHNPFSNPIPEHVEWLLEKKHIDQIITNQYDLVCNGYEVGGGSIRAHRPEILRSVLEIMGYSEEKIEADFGHMLTAFSLGTPPHGGCAQGVERLLMTALNEEYLREVQAFPQTGRGRTSVMDAPSALSVEQLAELGIHTKQTITTSKQPLSVFEKLTAQLESLHIDYKASEHEPVLTSQEAAKVRGVSLESGAKAMVMLADKQPIMVVVPGNKKVDAKALKKLYGFKDVEMVSREKLVELTDLQPGAVPPMGSLFSLPTYVDTSLGENKLINFNAGRHDRSIEMSYNDFLRVEQPIEGEFSK